MRTCIERIGKNAILMHFYVVVPDIRTSGEPKNIAVWKYGKASAKFLASSIKVIDTVGFFFSSFTPTAIKIPLKFPAFTFNKPKGWSVSALTAVFIMKGGSLKFCNTSGDHKNFTYTTGRTLNNYKILKFPEPPSR